MNIVQRYRRLTLWNRLAVWGSVASIVAFVIYLVSLSIGASHKGQEDTDIIAKFVAPHTLRVEGQYVEVYSKLKNTLWAHEFLVPISRAFIDDLNGDGQNEVVVALAGRTEEMTGAVMSLDYKGDTIWEFSPSSLRFNYEGGKSGKLAVQNALTSDLLGEQKKSVLVLYRDAQGWYQSCLVVLDHEGKLVAQYWHPGHMGDIAVGFPRKNSLPKVVISGINNDLREFFPGKGALHCIFLLNPKKIFGEAPPYHGGYGSGSHEWYGIVLPRGVGISQVDILDHDEDKQNEIVVWTSVAHILYIDFEGKIVGLGHGDGAQGEIKFGLLKE